MHTDALTSLDGRDLVAYLFNHTRDLMPERPGQWLHGRFARSIVDVTVANACSPNVHQNIAFTDHRHRDVLHLKGMMTLDQADGFHAVVLLCGFLCCLSSAQLRSVIARLGPTRGNKSIILIFGLKWKRYARRFCGGWDCD
jgi:hypothetical protein